MSTKEDQIFAAALQLFDEQGLQGTTTRSIAEAAGVSNGTLFHYFPTKEALILVLYARIKTQMRQELAHQMAVVADADVKTRIRQMFVASLEWALVRPQEFRLLQQFHTSPYARLLSADAEADGTQAAMALLAAAVEAGLLKSQPLPFLYALISQHTFGVNQFLLANPMPNEAQVALINDAFAMLWDMLANPQFEPKTSNQK